MKFPHKIISFFIVILLGGCSATGEKFTAPVLTNQETSTIYFMRKSMLLGAAGCRTVLVNGKDFGCIKSGGFLRINIEPGKQNITLPKITETDWADETTVDEVFNAGEIYYFEWTNELEDFYVIPAGALVITGGKTNNSIIKHTEKSALPILKELRSSI